MIVTTVRVITNTVAIPILRASKGIPKRSHIEGNIASVIASVIRFIPATPNKIKPIFLFFNLNYSLEFLNKIMVEF